MLGLLYIIILIIFSSFGGFWIETIYSPYISKEDSLYSSVPSEPVKTDRIIISVTSSIIFDLLVAVLQFPF